MIKENNGISTPIAIIIAALIIGGAILLSVMIYSKEIKIGKVELKEGEEKFFEEKPTESALGFSIENEPIFGSSEAKVALVEFSDFQCPFCARYAKETFPQIKKEYVDTGKIKIVFKNFPLAFHQNAQIAAEAGECAFEQGKFWEYKEKLFENQQALSNDDLKKYAKDLGLNIEQFNDCLDRGKFTDEVKNDFQEGQKAGVSGTPTFFINGEKLVGAQPFSEFQRIIEEKLK